MSLSVAATSSASRLALVVVLYNSKDTFLSLWAQLQAQTMRDWRVVVVDNASADGSGAAVQALQDDRIELVLNPGNAGFARAVNQGLRLASDAGISRFLLLNPDTSLAPGFLQSLVDTWDRHDWGVVAPRIMQLEDPSKSWYAGGSLDYGWIFANAHDEYVEGSDLQPRPVDFTSGCCLGLTKSVLERVGLFDESFFVYWEDTDFCMRLKAVGEPIQYVPGFVLLHEGGASSGGERSRTATRLYYHSYMQLVRKHFGLRTALTTMARVLRLEQSRTGLAAPLVRLKAAAMLAGLASPLRPVPKL